jgi:hypothetical protein
MNHLERSGCELEFLIVRKRAVFTFGKGITVKANVFIDAAHTHDFAVGNAGAYKQRPMLFMLKPATAMSCLPIVHQHFRVLRFITQRLCQAAMIFMCVREHNATDVRRQEARIAQTFA